MFSVPHILAFGFLTPWLFGLGAAAIAVPIIIHLLNRRRFRIVTWAAMAFLLAAQRRNARRLKFQRLLLLFLRCAALIVLAAAIAQFTLRGQTISAFVGATEQTTVLVWDDSYSMQYTPEGAPNHFERSRKVLLDYVDALGPGVRIALIKASRHAAGEVQQATLDRVGIRHAIQDAAVSDDGTDLPGALERAAKILKDAPTGPRNILVITDAAARSAQSGNEAEQIRKVLADLSPKAALRVMDVGREDQSNIGITSLTLRRPLVTAGVPVELEVNVTNGGPRPVAEVPVTILLNGTPLRTERIARIDSGATRTLLLAVTLPEPGKHMLEARVPADLLPVDDVRRLVVECRRETPVLLVDGSPADNQQLGSTTFLQLALAPAGGSATSVFAPRVITELELPHTPLSSFAAVVLSDHGPIDRSTAQSLQDYVNAGGLLVLFPGPRTQPEAMNQNLHDLLPASVGQIVRQNGDTSRGVAFDASQYAHPILAPFAAASGAGRMVGLGSAETQTYLQLNVASDSESEVVLKFASGAPAIVTRRVGAGRVILWATSADTRWSSLPAKPAYVPLIWEMFYYGLSPKWLGESLTRDVGERLNMPADAAAPGMWIGPNGNNLRVTLNANDAGQARLISDIARKSGVYSAPSGTVKIAVNPPGDEADIRHLDARQLAAKFGVDNIDTELSPQIAGKGEQQDIGRPLLLAALVLFAAETFFARKFSMYRR